MMNRRTFLRTAGALAPLWYDQPSPRYKLGLQLFTMPRQWLATSTAR
jgi:hypothetical protein